MTKTQFYNFMVQRIKYFILSDGLWFVVSLSVIRCMFSWSPYTFPSMFSHLMRHSVKCLPPEYIHVRSIQFYYYYYFCPFFFFFLKSSCLLHLYVWFFLFRLGFHLEICCFALCVESSSSKTMHIQNIQHKQMFLSLLFYIVTFTLNKIFSRTDRNNIRPHFITNSSTIFHCSSLQSLLLFYKFYYMLFRETVWGCAYAHCYCSVCIVPNFWTCCIGTHQATVSLKITNTECMLHSVALLATNYVCIWYP